MNSTTLQLLMKEGDNLLRRLIPRSSTKMSNETMTFPSRKSTTTMTISLLCAEAPPKRPTGKNFNAYSNHSHHLQTTARARPNASKTNSVPAPPTKTKTTLEPAPSNRLVATSAAAFLLLFTSAIVVEGKFSLARMLLR